MEREDISKLQADGQTEENAPENEGQTVGQNTQKNQGENGETAPALQNENGKRGKVGKIVGTVLLSVFCFLAGVLSSWLLIDPEARSLMLLKETVQQRYYQQITDEQFYNAAFSGVNGLLDDYSGYMTAEGYAETLESAKGVQSGIGVSFLTKDEQGEDQLLITRVSLNSPADGKLFAGEYVTGVGRTQAQIQPCRSFTAITDFLKSVEAETPLFLQVQSPSGTRVVEICKRVYREGHVSYRASACAYTFNTDSFAPIEKGEPLSFLPADFACIRLYRFNGSAAKEMDSAMALFKTQGKKHLILDLRGNGGGFLSIMQDISKYFCKSSEDSYPLVVTSKWGVDGSRIERYYASANVYDEYFSADSRIYVLADNKSASASECLLGVMLDYGATSYGRVYLSERLGEAKTYGKGIMQTTYTFPKGDAVKLTTAQIFWPISNTTIHGVGVTPTSGAVAIAQDLWQDGEIFRMVTDIKNKL